MRTTAKDSVSVLFNRYIWLVDVIYRSKDGITLDEINHKWLNNYSLNNTKTELPKRTFHNHRIAIEEIFEINIECDKRNKFRYFIDGDSPMYKTGIKQWLINSLSINNFVNESHRLKENILFDDAPSGQLYLTQIVEALRDNLKLEITYKSYNKFEASTFVIEPYCIKLFKQRWYIIAYNSKYESLRTYSLDRIKHIKTTNENYSVYNEVSPVEYFADNFGIITDASEVTDIKLKVYDKQVLYLRDLPLHSSQKEVEICDEYSIFSLRLRPTYDFVIELLSRPSSIEVLEPGFLREQIKEELLKALEHYK